MEQTKRSLSVKRRIYSFPMKGESRAEAVCRSFKQYTLVNWTKYNKVSIRIVTSVKYPLMMGEVAKLMSVSESFTDTTKVELAQETLGTNEEKLLLIIQADKDENVRNYVL